MATSGVLTSPDFPERYLNDLDIVQKIQVPEGNTIWIRFTDFDCEREYDYVTITDNDGTRLGLFDGGENGGDLSDDDWREEIVSNTETVEVLFHTDGSHRYTGWRLQWGKHKALIVNHFISFTEFLTGIVGDEESRPMSGVLMSPYYPSRYPEHHDSTQTVEVPEGKRIRFSFTNFDVEPKHDYVQVVDEDGSEVTPKLWGSSLPPSPLRSRTNIMHVKFHTDRSYNMFGWRMEWTEEVD